MKRLQQDALANIGEQLPDQIGFLQRAVVGKPRHLADFLMAALLFRADQMGPSLPGRWRW